MIKERFDQSSKNLDRMDSQFNQSDRCLDRMKSHIDEQDGKLDKLMDVTRETRQCLTGLEQEAWQSRPATESDVKPDTETRKRAEDAAADRVRSGDSFSAQPSRSRPVVPGQFR